MARWIPWIAIIAIVGVFGSKPAPDNPTPTQNEISPLAIELLESMKGSTLETEADVAHALANATSSDFAVVYVHFDWSIQSYLGRRRFAQFIVDYEATNPEHRVQFHFIDCTAVTREYKPITELEGWAELKSHGTRPFVICGGGELLWLKSGRIVHAQVTNGFESSNSFVKATNHHLSD